ncbi:MAG: zinc ribbon domain-containing protein [Chloroflexi bacterium]|nr:zinc ribbon domain-containing protein [Chloroflexota bacterium]
MVDKTEQPIASDNHFCAHCGTENAKGGHACTRCGERLIEIQADTTSASGLNSCARCGSANNTRAAYCWVCGSEMHDAIRITPKPRPEVQIPSAATPRTYRPDLNPVSTPANKPASERHGDHRDLRGPVSDSDTGPRPDIPISQQNPFGSPDAPAHNTSGTKGAEIPEEIKKWNWAAFLMPAVWGLFSGVPYTVVLFGAAFLPPTVQLIVMVAASLYLGAKGNELSWRGKKWRSVEHFKAFQKQWTSWAIKLTVAVLAILLFYVMSTGGA